MIHIPEVKDTLDNDGLQLDALKQPSFDQNRLLLLIFESNEQAKQLEKFSDFNDMAKHSSLGLKGVKR